jgi:hypothetical protein|tara:strand:- start:1180 stop:1389 length:210 start_codon:yes stop_codon:yes gene_type:complete
MKMVDDWRASLKWFSVQAFIAVGVIQSAWLTVPDEVKLMVPETYVTGLTIFFAVVGFLGRLVDQKKKVK